MLDISLNNYGKLLENLIFIELKRKESEIYFHRNGIECNFMVMKNYEISQLIQVSYDISNEKTLNRELIALIKLSVKFPDVELLLITILYELFDQINRSDQYRMQIIRGELH